MRAPKTVTRLRQEQIVEAALELVGEHGVSALSIGSIAQKVGIVPSALYRHFKSKDEVLNAVLDSIKERLLQNAEQVTQEAPDALTGLKDLLMRHAQMLSENRAIPLIVFSDGVYAGHPKRKAMVAEIITSYLDKIQAIISEGKKTGEIRKDVDPATTSVMFIGIILPSVVIWNVTEGGFDIIEHAQKVWPAFVRCIATESRIRSQKDT